jgi:hypothetical protein
VGHRIGRGKKWGKHAAHTTKKLLKIPGRICRVCREVDRIFSSAT